MNYLIGIDLGTSGTKTVLYDARGQQVASAAAEYPLYQPENGWAEQDPADWWDAVIKTIRAVVSKAAVRPAEIAGVGLSGQMHGLVMLDARGEVLRRAILWCDGRTARQCAQVTKLVGKERLIEITANPALTGFTAGKILWVRDNEPELYGQCRHILLPKDYIRYRLTGVFATDVSDASGMNLLDVPRRCWSDEILQKLNIDRALLGDVYESCEITGTLTREAAQLTGLAQETIVVGGAGDNAAAAVGAGIVETGKTFTTIGTSGVIFAHSDRVTIDPQGRVHTFCAAVPGAWTVMSCTLAAGLSLKWMRDNFFITEMQTAAGLNLQAYDLMDRQAARVPIGANRLLFLPYLMGERSPILDENSRGVFFGLSAIHTRFDMLRAVMEGVAYSMRQCLDVLRAMGVVSQEMLACGGGGSSPFWRQMLADVFDCPVKTAVSREGPALGAAILAGVGAGIYEDVRAGCRAVIQTNPAQEPDRAAAAEYEKFYAVYRKLYPSLREHFLSLSML